MFSATFERYLSYICSLVVVFDIQLGKGNNVLHFLPSSRFFLCIYAAYWIYRNKLHVFSSPSLRALSLEELMYLVSWV